MSGSFDLVINGKTVKANYGETLVDAGLSGWVAIPHDCCSGQCETCRVTVVSGQVDDRGTAEKGTVLACQAKVIGNAEIAFDHVPADRQALRTRDRPCDARTRHRRGDGHTRHADRFPARPVSQRQVFRLSGARSQPDGAGSTAQPVRANSSSTSAAIRAASCRRRSAPRSGPATASRCAGRSAARSCARGMGRSMLIGGGTGWAPIWSVAAAARREQRHRDLMVIAGSRDAEGLYMRRSLEWLIDDGVRDVIATAEVGADQSGAARAADALSAVARAGGHGLRRRPAAAGRCRQDQVARRRGALLCRSVPAERAAAVADRSRHGDAAPTGRRACAKRLHRGRLSRHARPRRRRPEPAAAAIPPLPAAAPRRTQAGSR